MAGNLVIAYGQYAALGWSPFGIEDLDPAGQVSQAYAQLSQFLPQFADWVAAQRTGALLATDDKTEPSITLGGYEIKMSPLKAKAAVPDKHQPDLAGGVALESRALPPDRRSFALVINPAPNEFYVMGANGTMNFAPASGKGDAIVLSKDEGTFKHGQWIAGRRINGDELFAPDFPSSSVTMMHYRLSPRD